MVGSVRVVEEGCFSTKALGALLSLYFECSFTSANPAMQITGLVAPRRAAAAGLAACGHANVATGCPEASTLLQHHRTCHAHGHARTAVA